MADTTKEVSQTKQPDSYPFSLAHKQVYALIGESIQNDEMTRAWARMYDAGMNLGPALAPKFKVGETEFQYFAYGFGIRDLSETNENKTVEFYNALGLLGEESGL